MATGPPERFSCHFYYVFNAIWLTLMGDIFGGEEERECVYVCVSESEGLRRLQVSLQSHSPAVNGIGATIIAQWLGKFARV